MFYKQRTQADPFTDLLFNALLGFTFLFLVAIMFMNPEAKSGIIDPKAEYIITITWEDNSPDDIDTWIEDPEGQLIWFRNPAAGLLHLDRDDRGLINDTITINGEEVSNPLNQEVVTLRGVVPGEYVLNLHYYATETGKPVETKIRLDKVNPKLEVKYYGTLTLENKGDEKTVLRFKVGRDGDISDINFLPKQLVILGQ
ncbi:MAG: hypothetical protein A3I13_02805 [Gammaproteobacteria bacterium RIFCSPLOWO2_02_FULL_47_50]|nr:MAG: hypothetical protein A2W69_00250 [Gammaproteobacteria bacterium RIFCSPLOWO2_02_47_7]OGT65612.1 MAG: hypothetical protein A2993_06210 [Gammaproteobacteria bacterium RIFCSPLOWO2_01_FULL_47_190]OGT80441.1 MAG: hypothetical protein A3I13_02805 [Gammaproteobacteria bacterium RIFCSPLOWO2_02_FULL_47_50]OGT83822.1 MAG: hypothetical protein A3G42_01490 [Gammaproteobacteria bacterium RIFCSPLOWO2_12_FULL_47_76]